MTYPNPHHINKHPSSAGVVAANQTSDASDSRHPQTACSSAYRDALRDLINHDGTSGIKHDNPKCPYGIALARNGYAAWANATPPALGKWVITPLGFQFLETRTTTPEETR